MNWHELFIYNPETGDLIWKERPLEHFVDARSWKRWNTIFKGKVAGYKAHQKGRPLCIHINLNHHQKIAHRIIWEMHHGALSPDIDIDHRDGNPWNNKPDNLRTATPQQNRWNTIKGKKSASGIVGIYWEKRRSRWVARLSKGRVTFWRKHFKDKSEAIAAYHAKCVELRGEYHGAVSRNMADDSLTIPPLYRASS